ncbi:LamG-like jellyroll fold domain-containing protein [Tamlana sp. I1]|uniref:LamG-like jellyroll fold domain-containing protein n=1 Tax=Tamlana sp. I1 TaxID=2762061 RepID=UPI00188EDFC8|nr:LamG-like jellyroll fold domain-containing protein [Tamlana sp. I1]
MKKTTFWTKLLLHFFILFLSINAFSQEIESINLKTSTNKMSSPPEEFTFQTTMKSMMSTGFYDSDGDGVSDNNDIDDDNDGIPDTIEEQACVDANGNSLAEFIFLNETFGVYDESDPSTARGEIGGADSPYTAYTGYGYEDGAGSNNSVNDGQYTLTSIIVDPDDVPTNPNANVTPSPTGHVATWAHSAWEPIEDHTPGDNTGNTKGRMALFNGHDIANNTFYETTINGLIPDVLITYSFWVINVDKSTYNRSKPKITVHFYKTDGTEIFGTSGSVFTTNNIYRCSGGGDSDSTSSTCPVSEWQEFSSTLTTSESTILVKFVNNAPGGAGNDLALDDIVIKQSICDMDGDNVGDIYDLDSDNDGIPDAIEANSTTAALSADKGYIATALKKSNDKNKNGMLDSLESPTLTPIDTDGDGIPNYLDLDSDNDGLFDVDESGATNSNSPTFINGDGDISGDGTGDGIETENFRGDSGTANGYGDGIIDIFDFHEGTNFNDSYGNNGQTSPVDTFGDPNIPDYLEVNPLPLAANDPRIIYENLLDANGKLSNTTDNDGDGIMDSRDGDDTVFGSPRNLDSSFSLYFDGRNDYVEDTFSLTSEASIMAFIKKDGANTNNDHQIIAGKDNFYLIIDSSTNIVSTVIEGNTLVSTTAIPENIWTHIAVATKSGETKLYINGVEEDTSTNGSFTDTPNFTIGRGASNANYFKGEIDEVRVFNTALTSEEIKRMVYQELDDTNGFNSGKIIPLDISSTLGSQLVKYYKMDGYTDDILDDKKSTSKDVTGAKMYNFKNIYFQKAPLPFITSADGDWDNSASWLYGDEWDISNKKNNPEDASIIHIKHNLNLKGATEFTQGTVGIIIDDNKTFTVQPNHGIHNSWYLELNGLLDLEGESQLIQTQGSILASTSSGALERNQEGAANLYTYNCWSSPVGITGSLNNSNYTASDIFDNIGFLTGQNEYDGDGSNVADYWIWKYADNPSDQYSEWEHIRSTGELLPGEGFTMKGTGTTDAEQLYEFLGKPFNGDISLTLNEDNDYLVGNPYPSSIDADQFIRDNLGTSDGGNNPNGNIINGALYFWDHFSDHSHFLKEYEGGYSVYTLTGATPAISNDSRINATGNTGSTAKRYIPVGQGFFVSSLLDPDLKKMINSSDASAATVPIGGQIVFKNSQRVFATEAAHPSEFLKSASGKSKANKISEDIRPKIRLKFKSPLGYHRQILLGTDAHATNGFDLGYEAELNEANKEDMYWLLNKSALTIQAIKNFEETSQILPLGLKTSKEGLALIKIDALENVDPQTKIYLHDKDLNTYHDLKESDFEIYLESGVQEDRFELTFSTPLTLETDQAEENSLEVHFNNTKKQIVIYNPNALQIESIALFNLLGQSVLSIEIQNTDRNSEYKTEAISTGIYTVKLKTNKGTVTKKVLVE